jgi:hypothetical protein
MGPHELGEVGQRRQPDRFVGCKLGLLLVVHLDLPCSSKHLFVRNIVGERKCSLDWLW